jgi:hypothetical protein
LKAEKKSSRPRRMKGDRFRRALDRRNVTEALSAATEIHVVGLVEALELTLLLADRDPAKYERAALR